MKDKKVIDSSTMECLEQFNEKETEQIFEKYRSLGDWHDFEIDKDGDLILFKKIK